MKNPFGSALISHRKWELPTPPPSPPYSPSSVHMRPGCEKQTWNSTPIDFSKPRCQAHLTEKVIKQASPCARRQCGKSSWRGLGDERCGSCSSYCMTVSQLDADKEPCKHGMQCWYKDDLGHAARYDHQPLPCRFGRACKQWRDPLHCELFVHQ